MSKMRDKRTKLEQPEANHLVVEIKPSSHSHQDTATGFDTEVYDDIQPVNPQSTVTAVLSSRHKPPVNAAGMVKRRRKRKRKASETAPSPYLVLTGDSDDEECEGNENHWETYRGMPSWLTSMLLHLSLILMLALLSVNNGGKQVIDLLAGTSEAVEIVPSTSFDLVLQPEEIETMAEDISTETSPLNETSELAPVLDEALTSTDLESALEQKLFENISTSGLEASDIRSLNNEGNAEFFGIQGDGSDFVFIIDCSDSMNDYGRWNQAVDELKRSIKKLTAKQRFLILLYNNGYIAMNNSTELVKSTQRAQKKAIRWLASKTPDNSTFCAEALADALKLQPSAVFLLSDGEFSDPFEVFGVLDRMNSKRAVKYAKTRQIPVHTVALGSHLGRFTMQRIARENKGEFKLIE